jgi:histidinol phosphatase-like enzyme (inositol monophosphatase family)
LRYFQAGTAAERKPDATPVTVADREAEALLRTRIERFHPGDGILGEEFGAVRESAPRRWILDPIDGTASFVRGVPLYGVLLGLAIDGEPIAGVIHLPALGEMIEAARGLGCRWNGRPARVSAVDRLEEAAILLTDSARPPAAPAATPGSPADSPAGWPALSRRAAVVRTWGDCYGHALVATGRAEAMIDPKVAPWDVAAIAPVVEEAGGVFTDLAGTRTIYGSSGLSTNAALAREVRSALGAVRG